MIALLLAASLIVSVPDDDGRVPLSQTTCENSAGLDSLSASCYSDGGREIAVGNAGGASSVVLIPMCGTRSTPPCGEHQCRDWEGRVGHPYRVEVDGETTGTICRTWNRGEADDEEEELTPAMVWNAFEELDWPTSELQIQPPGGRTLVNFETNFRTGNDEPHRQTVTLLGQQVEIEARPESYVWHFGDETVRQTETPGAPYPDLLVTHQYRTKDTFHPRVDTVYVGRFRIGDGPWIEIPASLTVEGEPQPLEVVGARPVLVAPDG